jgi:tetratricopeptide (TPR) repeat protein
MAMVTGCSRAPRYNSRLAAADSLMRSAPDSALALVEGVCRDSLAAECDRAYRDLLLTQARYRCYVTATSDSDINRALAYYRAHPKEREKLTRAYIYKGAVMEELDHPDSAMIYYKHAEATAAPDDYYNLGYSNLRIADLFLNEVSKDTSVIIRLQQAIYYFEKLRDTTLLISALGKLGTHCGISAPDSAKRYLWRAIDLACQFDSTQQYTEKSVLAGVYLFQGEYAQANKLAMDVLRHGKDYSYQNQYYYYAAMSFIKMGKIDSAKYVISIMPPPEDEVDSLTFYNLTAEISKAEGQLEQYGNNLYRSNKVESDILISSRKGELMVIDSIFEHKQSESRKTSIIKHNRVIIFASLILLLLLSFLILWMWWRHRAMLQEKAAMAMELEQALAGLQERQQNAQDIDVSRIVGLRLEAIQELYQDIRIKDNDSSRVKKIVPLTSFLKSLHERNSMMPLVLKDAFWQKMRASVDGELNGIVTFVENQYPELTTRDLQFFTLICAKISPQLIRLCMDIKNAKSVTNIRGYLMKKMGLDMSFDEFVSRYMNGELK